LWKAEAFRYVTRVVAKHPPFQRKPIRLDLAVYREAYVCSLTLATDNRRRAFLSAVWVSHCLSVLRNAAAKHKVAVLAYCFMPDHVHLLVHNTGRSSIVSFVREFKQMTGFCYKRRTGEQLWQRSYYDHFLRRDEDVVVVARYIFGNPFRAGLVAEASQYPFSGSFVWGPSAVVEG
jgi:putative transposase